MDGGADTATDNLGQADFSVSVAAPEPQTLNVLAAGLLLVWLARRRVRQSFSGGERRRRYVTWRDCSQRREESWRSGGAGVEP